MPRKRVPVGKVSPVTRGRVVGPNTRAARRVEGPDDVWLGSENPIIDVTGQLVGKPRVTPPRPRYQATERPGAFSLTNYAGHDPYELTLPIKFDRAGSSVEKLIGRLESLAERKRWAGRVEPPLVEVFYAGNPHPRFKWRIAEIVEREDRTRHTPGGSDRFVYVADVRLTQHVADEALTESLTAVLPQGRSRGIVSRRTRVKAGETSLHDVARRIYGDPGRASDVARANPGLRMGERLRQGRQLRLPA